MNITVTLEKKTADGIWITYHRAETTDDKLAGQQQAMAGILHGIPGEKISWSSRSEAFTIEVASS